MKISIKSLLKIWPFSVSGWPDPDFPEFCCSKGSGWGGPDFIKLDLEDFIQKWTFQISSIFGAPMNPRWGSPNFLYARVDTAGSLSELRQRSLGELRIKILEATLALDRACETLSNHLDHFVSLGMGSDYLLLLSPNPPSHKYRIPCRASSNLWFVTRTRLFQVCHN